MEKFPFASVVTAVVRIAVDADFRPDMPTV
jgi:hypothetical protein